MFEKSQNLLLDGWKYAFNFPNKFYDSNGKSMFVRRRVWQRKIRRRKEKESDKSVQVDELDWNLIEKTMILITSANTNLGNRIVDHIVKTKPKKLEDVGIIVTSVEEDVVGKDEEPELYLQNNIISHHHIKGEKPEFPESFQIVNLVIFLFDFSLSYQENSKLFDFYLNFAEEHKIKQFVLFSLVGIESNSFSQNECAKFLKGIERKLLSSKIEKLSILRTCFFTEDIFNLISQSLKKSETIALPFSSSTSIPFLSKYETLKSLVTIIDFSTHPYSHHKKIFNLTGK